jgi:hypothetical protein
MAILECSHRIVQFEYGCIVGFWSMGAAPDSQERDLQISAAFLQTSHGKRFVSQIQAANRLAQVVRS